MFKRITTSQYLVRQLLLTTIVSLCFSIQAIAQRYAKNAFDAQYSKVRQNPDGSASVDITVKINTKAKKNSYNLEVRYFAPYTKKWMPVEILNDVKKPQGNGVTEKMITWTFDVRKMTRETVPFDGEGYIRFKVFILGHNKSAIATGKKTKIQVWQFIAAAGLFVGGEVMGSKATNTFSGYDLSKTSAEAEAIRTQANGQARIANYLRMGAWAFVGWGIVKNIFRIRNKVTQKNTASKRLGFGVVYGGQAPRFALKYKF